MWRMPPAASARHRALDSWGGVQSCARAAQHACAAPMQGTATHSTAGARALIVRAHSHAAHPPPPPPPRLHTHTHLVCHPMLTTAPAAGRCASRWAHATRLCFRCCRAPPQVQVQQQPCPAPQQPARCPALQQQARCRAPPRPALPRSPASTRACPCPQAAPVAALLPRPPRSPARPPSRASCPLLLPLVRRRTHWVRVGCAGRVSWRMHQSSRSRC
jgi:hypothetical protein